MQSIGRFDEPNREHGGYMQLSVFEARWAFEMLGEITTRWSATSEIDITVLYSTVKTSVSLPVE